MRLILLFLLLSNFAFSQVNRTLTTKVERPKLVVGIVVDQMRWDYLYRFYDRYAADGGFKRLLTKGFSCENNFINYVPSYTACGHSTIYTGSVPAISGIAGNEWYEVLQRKDMYCVQDDSVSGVGTNSVAGKMSPKNLMVTTISDELKLATNFRSKVIGISFKDRGAILPAGHSANAAYWYEPASGKFISSTWYMTSLPQWITEFNNKKLPDIYLKRGWNTMYPINTYLQSAEDVQSYEGRPLGADQKGFPYKLDQFIGTNYGALTSTPYGNTLTKDLALAAINAEELGKDSITDFLAVSFSSPDYIGHSFGPNSVEVEDNYLRLDKDLGELFAALDKKVGKGQWLMFISADHGAAHVPKFLNEHHLPGGTVAYGWYEHNVDSVLRKKYGNYKLIESEQNSQFFFNHQLMDSLKLDKDEVSKVIINYLSVQKGISRVFKISAVANFTMPEKMKKAVINGYYPGRSGDIEYLMHPGYFNGGPTGTTHGSEFPYDTHIPLVWYGWNIKPGRTSRETHMTDVAPTLATMLRIQMPSGSIGDAIGEIIE
jgi:hypothetical protein